MKATLCEIAPGFFEAMKYGKRKMIENFAFFEETENSMIANTGHFVKSIQKFAQASLATASDAQKAIINDKVSGIPKLIKDLTSAVGYQKQTMKDFYETNGKIGIYEGQVYVHDNIEKARQENHSNDEHKHQLGEHDWIMIQKAAFFDAKRRKIHDDVAKLKKKAQTYQTALYKMQGYFKKNLDLLVSTTKWVDPKLQEKAAAMRAAHKKTDNEYMIRYTK